MSKALVGVWAVCLGALAIGFFVYVDGTLQPAVVGVWVRQ